MAVLTMAESKSKDEVNPTIFHDFLGRTCVPDSSPVVAEASPAVSGGGRGPISAASDLGSERHVANHLEGVPFYDPRSDLTGTEISNRFIGNKRSNSDSAFKGSSRDGFPKVGPDSLDGVHLMKMLRSEGGERSRQSHDEAMLFGMNPMRPTPTTRILQPPSGSRTDATVSKWERAMPLHVSPMMQYHPRMGQVVPYSQIPSNRFKDANAGPSVLSQAAADEGSCTGIKGSGILSSINAGSGVSDLNPSGVLMSGSKQKSGTHNSEPESSTPPSRHGLTSASRQMTIFYGGHAHVFDDVHPNKADVILALAGSNGGSWSTTMYGPKSAAPPPVESHIPGGDNETRMASNFASSREFRRRLSVTGTSSHGFGSGDQISVPLASAGAHRGSAVMKDGKNPVQAAETRTGEKREV
ncbi:Protein TIFY like [Actinidia chinensis var. chinensis]|uniref:Protein TIFY n=1 Tax=Actinidia chinensis var. chinensis TaxID=1590841 RepID=A0A2R6Q372_ACTCC|nr:Protein TIFY like [Actinidia chinensis var. chinensis]